MAHSLSRVRPQTLEMKAQFREACVHCDVDIPDALEARKTIKGSVKSIDKWMEISTKATRALHHILEQKGPGRSMALCLSNLQKLDWRQFPLYLNEDDTKFTFKALNGSPATVGNYITQVGARSPSHGLQKTHASCKE